MIEMRRTQPPAIRHLTVTLLLACVSPGCRQDANPKAQGAAGPTIRDTTNRRRALLEREREARRLKDEAARAQVRRPPRVAVSPTRRVLGALVITGRARTRSHTHGGRPAELTQVTFAVEGRGREASSVTIEAAALLEARCGSAPGWDRARPLSLTGLLLDNRPFPPATRTVRIPPGKPAQLTLLFKLTPVYQACDRFGLRARFRVGQETGWIEAPLRVVRRQPLHRR
jgi:hypothetical protein